jgi:hypothetical protein
LTLADLMGAAMNGGGAAQQQGIADPRAYMDYQIACMELGKQPLPYLEWVKAGKPKGPTA